MLTIASDGSQRPLGIVCGGMNYGQSPPYYDFTSDPPQLQNTTSSESIKLSTKQLLKSTFKAVDQSVSIDLKNLERLPQKPAQSRPTHQKALFGSLSFLSRLDWRGKGVPSRTVKSEPINTDVRHVVANVTTFAPAPEVRTLSPVLSDIRGSRLVTMGGEKRRLPGIVIRTVEEIYLRGVNTPNLFRTPEDPSRVQDLIKNFATPPNYGLHYDLAHENIHSICASLIQFLQGLPTALLDEAQFDLLLLCCSKPNTALEVESQLEETPETGMICIAQRILRHMPAERFTLLIYLFSFMSQTERSPQYDLTPRILGDCFGPALFSPRQSSDRSDALNDLNTSGASSLAASNVVVWMLMHWNLIVDGLLSEKFEIKSSRPLPAISSIKDSWTTWQGFNVNREQVGSAPIFQTKQIRRRSSALDYYFGGSRNFSPPPPQYKGVEDHANLASLSDAESKPFSLSSFESSTITKSHQVETRQKFRRRSSAFDYQSVNRTTVKKSPLGAGGTQINGKSFPLEDAKEVEEVESPNLAQNQFPRRSSTSDHDSTNLSSISTSQTETAVSDLSKPLLPVNVVGRDEDCEKVLKSFKFGDLPPQLPTKTSGRRQRRSPHPIVLTKSALTGIKSAGHGPRDESFECNEKFSFGSKSFVEGYQECVQESWSVPGTASIALRAPISPLNSNIPISPKSTTQSAYNQTSTIPFYRSQSPIPPVPDQDNQAQHISRRRSSCHESTSSERPVHRRINNSVSVSKYYDVRAHISKPIVKTIREIVAERKKGRVSHTHESEVQRAGVTPRHKKENSGDKSVRESQLMLTPVVYATWELVPVDLKPTRTSDQDTTNVKPTHESLDC